MADSIKEKRSALRQEYLNGKDISDEKEMLSLFLALSLNHGDANELCQRLLNRFGNLNNILSTDVNDLIDLGGCTKSIAVLLSSIYAINNLTHLRRNEKISSLKELDEQKVYFENILKPKRNEEIAIVSLDKNKKILGTHIIEGASNNFASTRITDITKIILRDKPFQLIVAHNHPSGDASISAQDISFTIGLASWVESMDVTLLDHIVVGKSETKAFSETDYRRYLNASVNS